MILCRRVDPTKANNFDLTLNRAPTRSAIWPTIRPSGSPVYSTLQLARGLGYGPADISLRPVFPVPLDFGPCYNPIYGNRSEVSIRSGR